MSDENVDHNDDVKSLLDHSDLIGGPREPTREGSAGVAVLVRLRDYIRELLSRIQTVG